MEDAFNTVPFCFSGLNADDFDLTRLTPLTVLVVDVLLLDVEIYLWLSDIQ